MAFWKRKRLPDADDWSGQAALIECRLRGDGEHTHIEIDRPEQFDGFPRFDGVVLREPAAGANGWEAAHRLTYSEADGSELDVFGHFLLFAADSGRLLSRGETWTAVAPVARDQIAGVVLGSRTNRAWIDDGTAQLVLVDHDRVPALMEFDTRGDDAVPRRAFDLAVSADGLALEPRPG